MTGIWSTRNPVSLCPRASAQTARIGSSSPIHVHPVRTPGRPSRCSVTSAAAAMHSGNSSLTQNIGSSTAVARSSRTP
ncbi:hypothetical protein D9M72_615690 [compost metagenome]